MNSTNESMIDPNPFVPDDIISAYHNRAVWGEKTDNDPRPKSQSTNKTIENLYRVQQLYFDIIRVIDNNLRRQYNHDENSLNIIRKKLKDRADNKVRSDSQGQLFIQIGDKYYYTGIAKEYEKFFNSTKKTFNLVLKEIAKELLNVINDKSKKESGKTIIYDEKNREI